MNTGQFLTKARERLQAASGGKRSCRSKFQKKKPARTVQNEKRGKTVFLNLTNDYFSQVERGEKNVEVRSDSPHWRARLQGATHVVFQAGYDKQRRLQPKRITQMKTVPAMDPEVIETLNLPSPGSAAHKKLFGDYLKLIAIFFESDCEDEESSEDSTKTHVPEELTFQEVGLLVGSACSGWGSELFALNYLKIPFTSVFACDTWGAARTFHTAVHGSHAMYDDVYSEKFMHSPRPDLFVAGFPCQPFSAAGVHEGAECHTGQIVFRLIEWLHRHQPPMFLLENVAGLVTSHSDVFYAILAALVDLGVYEISWAKLNCKNHGLPQNRERVFICGLLKSKIMRPMIWPKAMVSGLSVSDLLDSDPPQRCLIIPKKPATLARNLQTAMKNIVLRDGENPLTSHYFIDVHCGKSRVPSYKKDVCPCLTRSRAGAGGYWLSWKNRLMNTGEIMRFQGDFPHEVDASVVSQRSLQLMAGNAIPVPMLSRVLRSMLVATGFM